MTNVQKNEIVDLMRQESDNLGSQNKLATRLEVSAATVSQIFAGNWDNIKDEMFLTIGTKLGYDFSNWQIAETTGFRMVFQVMDTAKDTSLFIPISEKAGSGKSEPAKVYAAMHRGNNVYRIQCDEWAKREFLTELCVILGLEIPRGVISIYKMGQLVINFFKARADKKPLLIIDEADKLKPAALRFLISLFNALEDILGVVILGTEHLEKEIKKGVRLNKKGYDEIDSRFGRKYVHLFGNTKQDVQLICAANGITDTKQQNDIFKECGPIIKMVSKGQELKVVEDIRRIKRVVQRELKKVTVTAA